MSRATRTWPDCYTVRQETMAESRVWVYRLPQPGAMSVQDTVKIHEDDGYEFVRYGYGPAGEWGAEVVKRPGETFLFSPESADIHKIVCRAWETATPAYARGGQKRKLYSELHSEFFKHYHGEYMPTVDQLRDGTVRPAETIATLVAKLRDLPKRTKRNSFDVADTPTAREIISRVIDHIESGE